MAKTTDVAMIVGSLRKGSINRMVANTLIELAPAELKLGIVEIGQLQLYNQDLDDQPPAEWSAFRERIASSNAVLFVTPEYNRSIPAALKNALDVGSRPYGKSVWNGKPGAVVSASPSDRRLRRQSAFAADVRVSQHPRHAAARSVSLLRRQVVRSARQADQSRHQQVPPKLHEFLCCMGRHQRQIVVVLAVRSPSRKCAVPTFFHRASGP